MKNITGADSEFYEGGADTPGMGGGGAQTHNFAPTNALCTEQIN